MQTVKSQGKPGTSVIGGAGDSRGLDVGRILATQPRLLKIIPTAMIGCIHIGGHIELFEIEASC